MRRALWLLALMTLALVAYLTVWPVPIRAVTWKAPADPGYAGPHAVNRLNLISLGDEEGPEHSCWRATASSTRRWPVATYFA